MKAHLLFYRRQAGELSRMVFASPAAFAAARLAGSLLPASVPLALQSGRTTPCPCPAPEWVRLRTRLAGICGSDLSLIDGTASAYFDPLVSYPFTPGHEVVADVVDQPGRRVVVVPVLHCAVRGITPVCASCAAGRTNHCERVAFGHLEPGLQTGFCTDTGGGWSPRDGGPPQPVGGRARRSLRRSSGADRAHRLRRARGQALHGEHVAIIGAGTLGLLTLAAITRTSPAR